MSSETSTDAVRLKPDTPFVGGAGGSKGSRRDGLQADQRAIDSLQPWQFFVLAGLGCATAALFAGRGQGVTAVVVLTVLMAATALVGLAVLRTLRPLVSQEDDHTSMIGQRTRVALEREKMLALRAIKELEFDRAMGKVSDKDFAEMGARLRARATGLMRQLDAGTGYRQKIEREVERRLGAAGTQAPVEIGRASCRERV